MSDDYGRKIGQALTAVRRMHADVSKLLVDVEGTLGKGKTSVFGSRATSDTSGSYRVPRWMTWFVHRYFDGGHDSDTNPVDAICVCFIDPNEPPRFHEPLLLLGQIAYRVTPGQSVKTACEEWDLVQAYLDWSKPGNPNDVRTGRAPEELERVRWFKAIGTPLFSIRAMDDITALMKRVRAAPPPDQV